jgi:hypothetical protein
MTAHDRPGGPLYSPRSPSGVTADADRAVPYWGPDMPGPEAGPRTGGAAALYEAAFSDEQVARRRAWAKAAAAQRLEEVRTSAAAREAWLLSFPIEWRGEMARRVDEAYGPLEATT